MKRQGSNFMERLGLVYPRNRSEKPQAQREDGWGDDVADPFSEPTGLHKIKEKILYRSGHPRLLEVQAPFFKDRADAGRQLAQALSRYKHEDVIVQAIPRGGVIVGSEVARSLEAPLDLVFVRKIGHPMLEEYALGAVTEHGVEVWDETELGFTTPHWRTIHVNLKKAEAKRQRQLYLDNRKRLRLVGKTVIIVDDGAATGLTLLAAIKAARLRRPERVVVGVPVISRNAIEQVIERVDELVVLHVPGEDFRAVSDYYVDFPQTSDQAVTQAIKEVYHG